MSSMADQGAGSWLDPELWGSIRPELLEAVLAKLPFPSLVNFRAVCPHWKRVLIPRAARRAHPNSKSVLLLSHDHSVREVRFISVQVPCNNSKGPLDRICTHLPEISMTYMPWFEACNSGKTAWNGYKPSYFPAAYGTRMELKIVASHGGLLFFSFLNGEQPCKMLVCNPLTGTCNVLSLPYWACDYGFSFQYHNHMLIGAVVSGETGNYKLVVARGHHTCLPTTVVYDSLTCTWTKTPSAHDVDRPAYCDCSRRQHWLSEEIDHIRGQCISSNGSLYWSMTHLGKLQVLKYDAANKLWSRVQEGDARSLAFPFFDAELLNVQCMSQIALHEGKVMLLHLDLGSSYIHGSMHALIGSLAHSIGSEPMAEFLQLGPEMSLSREMIDILKKFIMNDEEICKTNAWCCKYSGFGINGLFYHVMKFTFVEDEIGIFCEIEEVEMLRAHPLKIVVYDPSKKACSYLRNNWGRRTFPKDFWTFSPSLISTP